ncbi:MAG: thioredoxin family protein [Polyangiaceae bacterium]
MKRWWWVIPLLYGCASDPNSHAVSDTYAPKSDPGGSRPTVESAVADAAAPLVADGSKAEELPREPSGFALPFIEDDYEKALADARAHDRPLFVDVWATWCHSCLSLKRFVFTDPRLATEAERFTWLAVDSEKPENAKLVAALKLEVLPTLFILDPKTERPAWTWRGSLTTEELRTALERATTKKPESALLAKADAAAARGDKAEARALYAKLVSDPTVKSERARILDAYVSLLSDQKAYGACADLARKEGPSLPLGTYRVDVAVTGVDCVLEGTKKPADRARDLAPLVTELETVLASPAGAILDDDRSGAFDALVNAEDALGDVAGKKRAASRWATFLESAAARAPTPTKRAVFDAHRMLAYTALGEPARALPMLEASERDFPLDFNPPARRARVLFDLGRFDEAGIAIDTALTKAYGGRRLRLYLLKADILEGAKRPDAARAALEEGLAYAKTLSLRESYEKVRKSIEARLAKAPAKAEKKAPPTQ